MTRWCSEHLRGRTIKLTACVLLVSLAVALTACGSSSSQPLGATTAPSGTLEAKPTPAEPIAGPFDAVAHDAELKFTAARFAGVALVDKALTIYISGTDKSDPATFEGYSVKHVRYSFAQLKAAQSRVDSVAEQLNSSGHTLFQWGVDVASNSVTVMVRNPKADSVAVIALIGNGPYRFIAGDQPSTT